MSMGGKTRAALSPSPAWREKDLIATIGPARSPP